MAGIFGHLNLDDSDYVYSLTSGQNLIWDAANDYIARINAEIQSAMAAFVQGTTEAYTERYKLPGGGYLQRRGADGRYGAVKASGEWDVAYPLEDFGAQISGNDVDMAYMTVQELDNHIATVSNQNINIVRHEMLKALLNATNASFLDRNGTLTIRRLANGDGSTYPPILGATSDADDTHYLESNYASGSISDTNNPYETLVEELVEHFGESIGGDNIVVFINPAEAGKTMDLTDFVQVEDSSIRSGANADVPVNLPSVPGKIIGRMKGTGACWVSQWRWMPANYMLAVHLEAPAPLKMRIDPVAVGLGQGLQLVAKDMQFPFESSFWRHRFGFGVANRLNGVVMELGTGGSYTTPTAYA